MPKQEPGTRPSAPLPYELLVNGRLNPEKKEFAIDFEVKKGLFGERSGRQPLRVKAIGYMGKPQVRDYAVAAGDRLHDSWAIAVFYDGHYHLRVDGPNGFCRDFRGDEAVPLAGARRQRQDDGKSEWRRDCGAKQWGTPRNRHSG